MLLVITIGPTLRSRAEETTARVAAEALAAFAGVHKVVVLPGARLLRSEPDTAMADLLEKELRGLLPADRVTSLVARVVVARDAATTEPREIAESPAIRALLTSGSTVLVAGWVPVTPDASGEQQPVDTVVDADLVAALLATDLRADALLLLDDVDGACLDPGMPGAPIIRRTGTKQLRQLARISPSMTRKIEAACRFVDAVGHPALIGRVRPGNKLAYESGTTVVKGDVPPSHQ